MNVAASQRARDLTLFAVGNTLLRERRRVLVWGLAGAVVAAIIAFTRPPKYVSTASFIPQSGDASRAGLASIAGQLGLSLPTTNLSQSPNFYVRLLRSRVLLEQAARDTFVVEEEGDKRIPFATLFDVKGASPKAREDESVRLLTKIVSPTIVKLTGIVEVSARTEWPSVSRAIVTHLLHSVDEFNQRARQAQAAAERQFVEGRLAFATADLRVAEDRLERFLAANRQFSSSPELSFERERLQRDVTVKQQVFMMLTQAYEDVRIREVRNTPVITVIESPSLPGEPQSRHRVAITVLGGLITAFAAVIVSLFAEALRARREEGGADAEAFNQALGQVVADVRQRLRLGRVAQ